MRNRGEVAMINSNFFHNIANVLLLVAGAASPLLVATGCVHDPILDKYDCSASWVNPVWIGYIVMVLAAIKIVTNITRDGIGGLIKNQPPVADTMTTVVRPVIVEDSKQAVDLAKAEAAHPPATNVKAGGPPKHR